VMYILNVRVYDQSKLKYSDSRKPVVRKPKYCVTKESDLIK